MQYNKIIVLIVEDDIYHFELLREYFRNKRQFQVIHAINGKEALLKFKDQNIKLILLDIKLPDISGYELSMQIKKMNKNIIIFAVTAFASEESKEICFKCGCDEFLSKPFTFNRLDALITKYFSY